jgi:hypothetical protein
MANDGSDRAGRPGNPRRSREHFRWDERHDQPHTDMSKWQKFWASRSDAAQFVRLLGRSFSQVGPVVKRYRALLAEPPTPHRVAGDAFGVAISPTRGTWDRYRERVHDLGVGALLVRIPSWDPQPVFDLRDELASLARSGIRLTFALVQDRSAVNHPERWATFVRASAVHFAELSPRFQVGHAINRKKWGVWHPDEYLRLLDATAPVRDQFPTCRWIGPPVIDFEYYFTTNYLVGRRPFDFDGIAALLYVDRRGSPDAVQYRHFDLRRKILLLRAVVQASPHPDVPIYLTEFNWPLRGTGKHSPAGAHVQTDEAGQARYLVVYYLTAAATGEVASSFWWQLAAHGYGLLDDETWVERRAYRALKYLLERVRGCEVQRIANLGRPLRGFALRRGDDVTFAVYTSGTQCRLDPALAVARGFDVEGNEVDPAAVTVGPDPLYLNFGSNDSDRVIERLAVLVSPVA